MLSRLLRNTAALLLGLLLGGAATWASAGYSFQGSCLPSMDLVKTAIFQRYPTFDPYSGTVCSASLTDFRTYVSGNIVGWYVDCGASGGATSAIYAATSCVETTAESLNIFPQNDVALVIAGVVLWAIGFSVGQKR